MHWVLVIDKNAFDEEAAVEDNGWGWSGCECDNWVDVAWGKLIGFAAVLVVLVVDAGKERLIIEFPRGYGCVFSFILAVIVAIPLLLVGVLLVPPKDSG